MQRTVEAAAGFDNRIDAVEVEGYNAAAVTHIETAEASVYMRAAGEMGMSHSNGCWESRHMDHPWDHLSPEREPLDTPRGYTEPDMEPLACLHSSEGCTAVSGPVAEAAIGHNSEDCTSGAVDIGQHTTTQRKSLAERLDCHCSCSGMRLATAAPVHLDSADCTWPGLDIAVAAAEVAAVPAGPSNLHSGPEGLGCIFHGSDWT